jgi:hypothetical protein
MVTSVGVSAQHACGRQRIDVLSWDEWEGSAQGHREALRVRFSPVRPAVKAVARLLLT